MVDARLVEAAAVADDPARLVEAATACRGELLAGWRSPSRPSMTGCRRNAAT
ncbi:MAG: hypothetical protein IPM99_17560 [Rubrivivax sp.]|nr:hypothetical protein [Rubrivivax sp.]